MGVHLLAIARKIVLILPKEQLDGSTEYPGYIGES